MGVHNITDKEQYTQAIGHSGLVVIDCFATWCGPCKVIAPELVKLSDKYTDAHFYKLDVDELPDLAANLEVRAMPTFIFFKDGKKVGNVVGADKSAIEAVVTEHAPTK